VVILGLAEGRYQAAVEGVEGVLQVSKGAVSHRLPASHGAAYIVRNPNVPVAKPWTIVLSKAPAAEL
jgi:hypothetical protein